MYKMSVSKNRIPNWSNQKNFQGGRGQRKKRSKNNKKIPKNSTIKLVLERVQRKKDRKIAKKDQKIAILNLLYMYSMYENPGRGMAPLPPAADNHDQKLTTK